VSPFQSAFPNFEMKIVALLAEGDRVVGHVRWSGTHPGRMARRAGHRPPVRER
jgi:predicted ester cyclase